MLKAPIPENEGERMEAVHRLSIMDTGPEDRFDKITREAAAAFNVPISTISIIDAKLERHKSCVGLDKKEGDRAVSFCGHALLAKDLFIVEDTLKDPRFADNPMVVGSPFIRFYAGIALYDQKTGQSVGVFCIKDTKPRKLSLEEVSMMSEFAERAEKEVNAGAN